MQINRKRKLELDILIQTREIFFEFSKWIKQDNELSFSCLSLVLKPRTSNSQSDRKCKHYEYFFLIDFKWWTNAIRYDARIDITRFRSLGSDTKCCRLGFRLHGWLDWGLVFDRFGQIGRTDDRLGGCDGRLDRLICIWNKRWTFLWVLWIYMKNRKQTIWQMINWSKYDFYGFLWFKTKWYGNWKQIK